HVPEANRFIIRPGDQGLPVREEGDTADPPAMAGQPVKLRSRGDIPEDDCLVSERGERFAVRGINQVAEFIAVTDVLRLPGRRVPDVDGPLALRGGNRFPVWG